MLQVGSAKPLPKLQLISFFAAAAGIEIIRIVVIIIIVLFIVVMEREGYYGDGEGDMTKQTER